jgi:methyltransferase
MLPARTTSIAVMLVVGALMLAENALSRRNERRLRGRGAIEAAGDVFPWMRIAYPAGFLLIGLEGAWHAVLPRDRFLWGMSGFAAAKALKYWAVASLGDRWSFEVLVERGVPLVARGPYRLLRHPNYLALLGEYAGIAVALSAPVAGVASVVVSAWLLRLRIRVEERALGLSPTSDW